MAVYNDITELSGKTPLLRLHRLEKAIGAKAMILAKLEYFNPAGSVKDRVALEMLNVAEKSGALSVGSTIIEPTSGNTGIGLAMAAAVKGYKIILTMPESMSAERRMLLSAYGAQLVLTPASEGMGGAIKKAEELSAEIPGSFIPGQFVNPANPAAHFKTTGPEIFEDTEGKVDIFVSAVGTGGTFSGTAEYLKSRLPQLCAVAVEPATSAVISGEKAGAHKIQGIGAGFIPATLDVSLIDETMKISDAEAYACSKKIPALEGILVGISAGSALAAAEKLALREENTGKTIVVILPDTGERYLSSGVFD